MIRKTHHIGLVIETVRKRQVLERYRVLQPAVAQVPREVRNLELNRP